MFRNYISQAPIRSGLGREDKILEEDTIWETEKKGDTSEAMAIFEAETKNENGTFFEVELTVDDVFDGDLSDIKLGQFVSFRYSGEASHFGPPKNPKISM